MFPIALAHLIVVAHLLHVPLSHALEAMVYPVPTALVAQAEQDATQEALTIFEWRLHTSLQERVQRLAPRQRDLDRGPELQAAAAIVMDESSQQVLWQLNPDAVRSVASLTKLMTALVWLDHKPADGFFAEHTFDAQDNAPQGKELDLPMGEKLTLYNIWRSTLIASHNDTALALMHSAQLSSDDFVEAMNTKAQMIGMQHAQFVEPTGLSSKNVASAEDLARLALQAFSHPEIAEVTTMTRHVQETVDSRLRTVVYTTNTLLTDDDLTITGGKTGYTDEAGYCVIERVQIPGTDRNIIVVILGAESDASRFTEAKKLAQWTFAHHSW